MRPFLFITSLVHSLGPTILPKRSKYDITFSYFHSLKYMITNVPGKVVVSGGCVVVVGGGGGT